MMRAVGRIRDWSMLALSRWMPQSVMSHYMFLLKSRPQLTDAWGYHIRTIHYYEPLPDFRRLTPGQLSKRRVSPAIDFRLPEQKILLAELGSAYTGELEQLRRSGTFDFKNTFFTGLDACSYYSLIRRLKPRRVLEVGSGYSTQIAAAALARNDADGQRGSLVCVEPYPEPRLTESGVSYELIERTVQDVDSSEFERLGDGDILFIDSSHVACAGSDVLTILFEVLPRLTVGVWIHVHDIFFPTDYPADWLIDRRVAFNEQYMLEAFLSFNHAFSVRLANHWLALDDPELVAGLCPEAIRASNSNIHDASSFWIRKESGAT